MQHLGGKTLLDFILYFALYSMSCYCYTGEDPNSHFTTSSFQGVGESDKISHEPPLLQTPFLSDALHKTWAPDILTSFLTLLWKCPGSLYLCCSEGAGANACPVSTSVWNEDAHRLPLMTFPSSWLRREGQRTGLLLDERDTLWYIHVRSHHWKRERTDTLPRT